MLKIYTAPVATYNTVPDLESMATKIYDLDAIEDSWIKLDYNLSEDPGGVAIYGDMYAYLPYSMFAGREGQYLYLYSHFGAEEGDWGSFDGQEEWARVDGCFPPPSEIPEPATLLLLGGGLVGGALIRRKRI